MNISQALNLGAKQLNSETPRLDAELLLAHVLMQSRTYLFTWPEKKIDATQWEQFFALIEKRAHGIPVAYLLGYHYFWDLKLQVTPDVLVPRPETELLVESALDYLPNEHCRIADLGTGSGAIALALAKERPNWQIIAIDNSAAALDVAKANAKAYRLSNVTFIQNDWLYGFDGEKFDAIISNPPYISPDDPHLAGPIRHEPQSALQAANAGLAEYEKLCPMAKAYLRPGGWLMLEHGQSQAEHIIQLLSSLGAAHITSKQDLAEINRVIIGQFL